MLGETVGKYHFVYKEFSSRLLASENGLYELANLFCHVGPEVGRISPSRTAWSPSKKFSLSSATAVFGIYEYAELRLINMNGYGGLVTAFLDQVAFISTRCQLWTSSKFNNQTENLEMVNFALTANIE